MTRPDRTRPVVLVAMAKAILFAPSRALTGFRCNPPPERIGLLGLVVLALTFQVAGSAFGTAYVPPGLQAVTLLGGGLLLRREGQRLLSVVVAVLLAYDVAELGLQQVRPGALIVVGLTGLVAYEFSRSREETGLSSASADTFLLDLRARLQAQGELPELPLGWHAEAVLRPAGGGPFAGDFVVSALCESSGRLELALVDVSGKGLDAGTRALLLSGALGGLLGSPRPEEFLPAANRYLARQDWEEGFATAVHLVLDLEDGAFAVESAGHPPVAHFVAGTGRWRLLTAEGPALGLLSQVSYAAVTGKLGPGDALLLYTDGLVEVPGRDLEVGIDKLLGEAERLVPRGFAGGGEVLVTRVASASTDDRGLVLIWRSS